MDKKIFWILIGLVFTFALTIKIGNIKAQSVDHIIISQLETGEATSNEFVELFNPTESSIDLTKYKLTRRNSGGISEANLVASLSGTIAPNGYFLIGHGTGYTGSVPLDKVYSAPSNALTNNYSVRIYSDADLLLDKVAYGTSPDAETLHFSVNPTAGQSIRRINNQDTDNNSIDFELLTSSSPRNSSYVQPTESPIGSPKPTAEVATPTPTVEPTVLPTQIPTSTPTTEPTEDPIKTPSPTPIITPTAFGSPKPTAEAAKSDHYKNNHWLKRFFENYRKFIYEHNERLHENYHDSDRRWPSFTRFFRYINHR